VTGRNAVIGGNTLNYFLGGPPNGTFPWFANDLRAAIQAFVRDLASYQKNSSLIGLIAY
jgi:hypothetical protein